MGTGSNSSQPEAMVNIRERLLQVIGLHQRGELPQAVAGYRAILEQEPRQFDALRLLGAGLGQMGRYAEAVDVLNRAIAVRADFAETWISRAECLVQLQRLEEAISDLERAVQLRPELAPVWNLLGVQLQALGRHGAALLAFDRAGALTPQVAAIWSNRSLSLGALKRPLEALADCDRAISLQPDIPHVWCNRAKILGDLRRSQEALECLERAIALDPNFAPAHASRAAPLRALRRLEDALAATERALILDPALGSAWSQRGACLSELSRYEDACASYERALQFAPHDQVARFNRGLLLLSMGRFEEGWGDYELREGLAAILQRYPYPVWNGSDPLTGKTLLLHCEQGLGDTVQFCRFATVLAQKGARVVLTVPAPLLRLLVSLEGEVQVVTDGDTLPAVDLQCALLSVPHRLGCREDSIPARVPYLYASRESLQRFRAKLPTGSVRIGLVVTGSSEHGNDGYRSSSLAELAPLVETLAARGVHWHLLQRDLRAADAPWLAKLPIVDHREELVDFCETAALASCMDAVVSVDTSVAHLAGALGVPLFLLLPTNADWRWLTARSNSPWYPGARLVRQRVLGQWKAALEELQELLVDFHGRLLAERQVATAQNPPSVQDLGSMRVPTLITSTEGAMSGAGAGLQGRDRPGWRDDQRLWELQQAARAAPGEAAAQFNLGVRLLTLGQFRSGWEHYEWRQRVPALFTAMPDGGTYWDGSQSPVGRTLLVCQEQGLGDVIQFCRYLPLLAQLGVRVVLGVDPALARLMASLEGVAQVCSGADAIPPFDLKCLIISLAHRFDTNEATIPAPVPYLKVPEDLRQQWNQRVSMSAERQIAQLQRPLRIGIVCSGSLTHAGDRLRSIPLALMASLVLGMGESAAQFHLLQRDLRDDDHAVLRQLGIVDHRQELHDMAQTAALVSCMDLVVSVDTAVAHLVGALGLPLLLLLPRDPDWRWQLDRRDSPWYPSAQLFRCQREGDWTEPLQEVLEVLQTWRVPAAGAQGAERSAPAGLHLAAPVWRRSDVQPPDLARLMAEASTLHKGRNWQRAAELYREVLSYVPDQYDARRLLGAALFQGGEPALALPELDAAIRLRSDATEPRRLRAEVLAALGEFGPALQELDAVQALGQGEAALWATRARYLQAVGQLVAARQAMEHALADDPHNPRYRVNRALLLLLAGDFAAGWPEHEARMSVPELTMVSAVNCPYWDGKSSLSRRTLLILCEQGLGDTIMFARFAPVLAARGARVVLGVQGPLVGLLRTLRGVERVVTEGDALPPLDYQCWIMSLPALLQVNVDTIPAANYLSAPAASLAMWRSRLDAPVPAPSGSVLAHSGLGFRQDATLAVHTAKRQPRIALVCSGSRTHAKDAFRSMPLSALFALLDHPNLRDCHWHLAQVDLRDGDAAALAQSRIVDHRAELVDFSDTAALLTCMDAVVSVDTSVAHLAGALGLALYLLLPVDPDWRWMLERSDSPWYPSARLFRQQKAGDWDEVVQRLADRLAQDLADGPR